MKNRINALVTIAIPIFNGQKYLRDAIQSVINQTYRDWILILINDGSTDGSLAIMQEFSSIDDRVIIQDDGINKGLISRLNESIELCKTKYYARMDADDIMYVTRIEEQVKFMESHPTIDVCGTSIMTIDVDNNIVGSGHYEGKVEGFVHPTVMGRSEWFKSNQYADWALRAEDYELWVRTSGKSNFYSIGRPLFFYREFGVPTFKKYYLSQRTIIRIAVKYKQYNKAFSWASKVIIGAVVKIVINALLASVGKMDMLVSMRKRKIVPMELLLNEGDLQLAISKNNSKSS